MPWWNIQDIHRIRRSGLYVHHVPVRGEPADDPRRLRAVPMYGAPSEHPAYAGRHRHRGVGLHRGLRHQQQPGGHMGSARLRARRVLWRQVGMDTGAMALGVILGPMIEENLGKSVDLSRSVDGGLMSVMFEGSINKVLIAALLLSLLTPFLLKLRNRKHAALLPEGPPSRLEDGSVRGDWFPRHRRRLPCPVRRSGRGQPCLSRSAD